MYLSEQEIQLYVEDNQFLLEQLNQWIINSSDQPADIPHAMAMANRLLSELDDLVQQRLDGNILLWGEAAQRLYLHTWQLQQLESVNPKAAMAVINALNHQISQISLAAQRKILALLDIHHKERGMRQMDTSGYSTTFYDLPTLEALTRFYNMNEDGAIRDATVLDEVAAQYSMPFFASEGEPTPEPDKPTSSKTTVMFNPHDILKHDGKKMVDHHKAFAMHRVKKHTPPNLERDPEKLPSRRATKQTGILVDTTSEEFQALQKEIGKTNTNLTVSEIRKMAVKEYLSRRS